MALLSSFPATNILGIQPPSSSSTTATVFVSPTSSASITGGNITLTTTFRSAVFQLAVAQTSPSSSHLLDVYASHSVDGGVTYDDFVHFGQVAGKVSTAAQIAQWVRDVPSSSSATVRVPSSQTLAAGTVLQGPIGATWRGFAVVTGASSSQPWKLTLAAQVAQ